MFQRWQMLERRKGSLCASWEADFWSFVADIGEPPEGCRKLQRLRQGEPFGPDNYRWALPLSGERKVAYHASYNRRHYQQNRERWIQSRYGIGQEEYHALYLAQGGGCAICGKAAGEPTRRGGAQTKALAVDHCHETGIVRGLLCTDCNVGIGLFGDSPARLELAAAYLTRTGRKSAA